VASLWADPQPDESGPPSDVVARVVPEEPEPAAAPAAAEDAAPQPVRPGALAIGVLVSLAIIALASSRGSLEFKDVPSYWDQTPMTCQTTRIEQGARSFELFNCHALGSGVLPPGIYQSPDSLWNSDITRREALANGMEISPDGTLTGWAAY
jgi:hypothetical protein